MNLRPDNNPKAMLIILIIISIFLTGCTAYDSAKESLKIGDKGDSEEFLNATVVCPEVNNECIEPDQVTFTFESQNQQERILDFLGHADNQIYCSFPVLEDEVIAQKLIEKANAALDVRVIFDRASSFENCETACVAREGSKYNRLVSEAMDVSIQDTKERFCATDDGVFWWSGNWDALGIDESHYFYSEDLAKIYRGHFKKLEGKSDE